MKIDITIVRIVIVVCSYYVHVMDCTREKGCISTKLKHRGILKRQVSKIKKGIIKWRLICHNRMRASLLLHFLETEAALPFPTIVAAPALGDSDVIQGYLSVIQFNPTLSPSPNVKK
jgi:hypothetical protein